MRNIVLSAIVAMVVTVGVYHIALLAGAREPAAVAAAVAAIASAAVALAALAAVGFAAAVAVTLVAFVAATVAATPPITAAIAFFAVIATIAVIAAAEQERVRFRWVALAYVVEGLAIWGALAVGNPGWSAAIVLGGVVALLTLWRAHSRLAALDAPPVAEAVQEQNGA